MREGEKPIGRMGPAVRAEREAWVREHDPFKDPICRANCSDICRAYNIRYVLFHSGGTAGQSESSREARSMFDLS